MQHGERQLGSSDIGSPVEEAVKRVARPVRSRILSALQAPRRCVRLRLRSGKHESNTKRGLAGNVNSGYAGKDGKGASDRSDQGVATPL